MPLAQPLGLLGLLGAVPVVALYLLRRRPRAVEVPSLLLFRRMEDAPTYRSFLRRLMRERSLLLQLLAIGLASLALAGPYTVAEAPGGLAVVVDGSASMSGFTDEAAEVVNGHLDGEVTLIQAGPAPRELLVDGPPDRARDLIDGVQPLDGEADLSAAMTLAERRGAERVVVVSDFLGWKGRHPGDRASAMEATGVDVVFEPVGEPSSNVGFVDGRMSGTSRTFRLSVARFGGAPGDVTYGARVNGEVIQRGSVHVEPGGRSGIVLDGLPAGEVVVELDDAGPGFDDRAFGYVPEEGEEVLVVGEDGFEARALDAAGASVTVAGPSSPLEGFELVVLKEYAGVDYSGLEEYVRSGGLVVFVASGDISRVPGGILPIEPGTAESVDGVLEFRATGLTSDVSFEDVSVNRLLSAEAAEGAEVHVETADGTPVVASRQVGEGEAVYLGLPPSHDWNDFHFRREYPVFWTNVLEGGAIEHNLPTGERLDFGDEVSVETPYGSVSAERVYLDRAGLYRWEGGTVAANLFSGAESDTSSRLLEPGEFGQDGEGGGEAGGERRTDYTPLVLLLLAAVLLYEARLTGVGR